MISGVGPPAKSKILIFHEKSLSILLRGTFLGYGMSLTFCRPSDLPINSPKYRDVKNQAPGAIFGDKKTTAQCTKPNENR